MVITKYRGLTGDIVEALQFRRSNWQKLRHFTKNAAHSLMIPKCHKEQVNCKVQSAEMQIITLEHDWIIKKEDGLLLVKSPDEFLKEYKAL